HNVVVVKWEALSPLGELARRDEGEDDVAHLSSSPISSAIASSQSASRVGVRFCFFFFAHFPNFGSSSGRACSSSFCSLMSRFTDANGSGLSALIFHLQRSTLQLALYGIYVLQPRVWDCLARRPKVPCLAGR